MDASSLQRRQSKLIANGFFGEPRNSEAVVTELNRRHMAATKPGIGAEVDKLVKLGFLIKTAIPVNSTPHLITKVVMKQALIECVAERVMHARFEIVTNKVPFCCRET